MQDLSNVQDLSKELCHSREGGNPISIKNNGMPAGACPRESGGRHDIAGFSLICFRTMISMNQLVMPLITRPFLCYALLVLLLAGCAPTIANRGAIIDADKLAEVKPGSSTREEVATKLGTPTQVSTFDEKIWYYFGQQTEQYSFLDPKVTERQTIAIAFNDEGVVTAVSKLSPNDVSAIDPVGRRTPTYGHETTVLEQLVGNLGRPGRLGGDKGK